MYPSPTLPGDLPAAWADLSAAVVRLLNPPLPADDGDGDLWQEAALRGAHATVHALHPLAEGPADWTAVRTAAQTLATVAADVRDGLTYRIAS